MYDVWYMPYETSYMTCDIWCTDTRDTSVDPSVHRNSNFMQVLGVGTMNIVLVDAI